MSAILAAAPLGFPWPTEDPFLFCVHHLDAYPRGREDLSPDASLRGRDLGQDFELRDGFRMYHGTRIPGFPQHPHRGFETITILRRGAVDHSDSLGARARFGPGDVQWMTAGRGVVHAEMFPMLNRDADNTLELFQIWLNLPASHKLVEPHFKMLWSERIPRHVVTDASGRTVHVTTIAGAFGGTPPPSPPPHSWAANADAHVGIRIARLDAGARWTLEPARDPSVRRTVFFFVGDELQIDEQHADRHAALSIDATRAVALEASRTAVEVVVLEGRPIDEPVAQYGPFVMNTPVEIQQAFADYRATRFGGWPWSSDDPVHARDAGRFAQLPTGERDTPPLAT